jgi:outer membrane immunogenic protein
MKTKFFAMCCAAMLSTTAAHAETFNGFYIGGTVGYDKLSVKASSGGVSASISGDSVSGGAIIGYNATVGEKFVIGGEVEGVIGGGKISDGVDTVKTDVSGTAGVRAGFLATPKLLIYGKVAYARTQLSVDDESESGNGVAFGGGVEFGFSDRFSGRLSYTRTSYSVSSDAQAAFGTDVSVNRDQLMASVAFHF